MRAIHSARLLAVGVALILGVIGTLGARSALGNEHPRPVASSDPCSVSCGQDAELECRLSEHIAESGYHVDQAGPHGSRRL